MKKGLILSALLILAAPGVLPAQKLAVPGFSPTNPLAVLSVPETSTLRRNLASSKLGSAMLQRLDVAWNQDANRSAREQLAVASESLGFSLAPLSFAVEQVSAFDLYVVEHEGFENYLVAIRMREPGIGTRLLDRLREEATGATGISGNFRADTVVERALSRGGRTVFLPAFEMYFADLSDRVLLYSTSQPVLESALADDGRAMFVSAYFERFSKGVGSADGQPWMLGELDRFGPIATTITGLPAAYIQSILPESGVVRFGLGPDRIELTSFTPQTELKGEDRRYALAAPPASRLDVAQRVPATAKIAYATSYFDGIHAFDSILKLIDRVPGRAGTARTVTTALEASRSELGFDPKTDFLAGLGPEMAIYVTSLKTGAEGLSAPKEVEGAFVAQVRDHARFSRIVRLLEERISPPPPPRQPNAPAEPAPNPITSEEVGDVTIRSVAVPPMAWALSNDRFYVGTSPSAVREALGLATSAEGNITTTNDWRGASAAQEAARTSVFVADGTRLLDLFQDISAEWKAVAAGMEYLSVATIYRPEGRKQQLVILTSPAN